MEWSYIIVQALSSKRLQGFKLRPSLPPRQGLTPPLPPWRGLWPSQIGTAWASALPSLPAADTRVTSRAERRSAGDTGEGDSEGGGEYMARSQPIVYTRSHPVTHSVTTSHTPPPTVLTCSSFILPTLWLSSSPFSHTPVLRHISLLSFSSTQQLSKLSSSSDLASVQQGQLCDNNHVIFTCIMRSGFQQTKHSQHKPQQAFTVILLLYLAVEDTIKPC